jgi:Transglycosylase SLT domain
MPQQLSVEDMIRQEADKVGIPPALALAVAEQESSFNPMARGPKLPSGQQAVGTFQLLPSTAKTLGVDPNDPYQNIVGGTKYLRQLLDQHEGDAAKALATYGGVVRDQTYVPSVLARLQKFSQARAAAAQPPGFGSLVGPSATGATTTSETPPVTPPATPPAKPSTVPWAGIKSLLTAFRPSPEQIPPDVRAQLDYSTGKTTTPPPPTPFFSDQGILHGLGLDPRYAEDWRNIGGTAGGITGGVVGGLTGGPAGAYAGSILGSTAGGSLGQGVREWLGPPPTPDEAERTKDTSTLERIALAGGEQGLYDVAGQAIALPARAIGKRVVQKGVSKAAQEYFEATRRGTVDTLETALDSLRSTVRRAGYGRKEAGVALKAGGEAAISTAEAAKQAGLHAAEGAERGAAGRLTEAQETAKLAMRGVRREGAAGIRAARSASQQGVEEARAAAQASQEGVRAGWRSGIGTAPGEIPTGQSVLDILEGPASEARTKMGRAVDAAAKNGPAVDITPLADEAQRLLDEEILPQAQRFPGGAAVERAPGAPPGSLAQLSAKMAAAQEEEVAKNPVARLVVKILNARQMGAKVPFEQLHAWKSELQTALASAGAYDRTAATVGQRQTKHLAAEMRRALSAAGHAPYEQATAAYADLMPLFEHGYADQLAQAAIDRPERIVQMINPNEPTSVRMLTKLLTDVAEHGGGPEGRAQGEQALGALRRAWLDRNVLRGGIEQLPEALAKLKAKPEFVDALFNTPESKQALDNIQALATLWQDELAKAETSVQAAKRTGKAGVTAAQDKARTAIEAAQAQHETRVKFFGQEAGQAGAGVEATREVGEEGVEAARKKAASALASHGATDRAARLSEAEAIQAKRGELRQARKPTPEELAFKRSSVSPEALSQARRSVIQVVKAMLVATVGYKALGPLGLGAATLAEKGVARARSADLLRYAVHSGTSMQAFIEHFAASAKPGWVAGQALRAGERKLGPPPKPAGVYLTISGDDKR